MARWDVVAERHGFSSAMRAAGWRALLDVEVCEPMVGYGDLDELAGLGERRFLVTSGFRRLQESKVRALGIASLFDEVVIDAIDEAEHPGKEKIFLDLMARYHLEPADVVVVGDNPASELAVARRLGLMGVQILRAGVEPADNVSARVGGLAELRRMLESKLSS